MANALDSKLVITNPDFDTIKSNLKNFLRAQDVFSDYDFEGSGLANLIDLLAYNTHYMSFYMNMIANESFLDTASIRSAVVSHAKMLGYTPTSTTSAIARINLTFTQANNPAVANLTALTIPRFTRFSSSALNGVNYIFSNLQEVTVSKANNAFTFNNLVLTEGTPVNYVFEYNQATNPKQEFLLPDVGVDTKTIEVIVQNSTLDATQSTYFLAQNATEVSSGSRVYYIEESDNLKYRIYFGDDILGKKLSDGNIVIVSYLLSSGGAANKSTNLTLLNSVGGLSVGNVAMVQVAAGGGAAESIDKIKFTAPKNFVSNNRAVTKNDYIALIEREYPSLESVNVWGGEENDPPVFGKVFISAKPATGYEITATEKQFIIDQIINPLSVVTVTPEFIDPDYNYLNLSVKATYDPSATTKTIGEIQTTIKVAIYLFARQNLNAFNSYFKISRLMREIDNADTSILSNQIDLKIEKRLEPSLNSTRNYTINFYTELARSTGQKRINSYPAYISYDAEDNEREFFLEEIPLSFTGISEIKVLLGGSNLTRPPELRIIGDGIGASATAIITNGKVTSVRIGQPGSEYTTVKVLAYDQDGKEITNIVLEAVIENRIGKMRSFYYDDNEVKVIFSNDAGTIDYNLGKIYLNNFSAINILNDTKILKFYATPNDSLFSSSRNSIITIDEEDLGAITVEAIQVR